MAKNILVINVDIRETRVALIENGIIAELHMERHGARGTLGNIYLGKVSRVLPGMQAAFIDIGQERAAFLHVEDLIRQDDFEAYLANHKPGGRRSEEHEGGSTEEAEDVPAIEAPDEDEIEAAVQAEAAAAAEAPPEAEEPAEADEPGEAEELGADSDSDEQAEAEDPVDSADDAASAGSVDSEEEDEEILAGGAGEPESEEEDDEEARVTQPDGHYSDEAAHADDAEGEPAADDEESDDEAAAAHVDAASEDDSDQDADGPAEGEAGEVPAVAASGEPGAPQVGAPSAEEDEAGRQAARARTRRGGRRRRRGGKTKPDEVPGATPAAADAAPAPAQGRGRQPSRFSAPQTNAEVRPAEARPAEPDRRRSDSRGRGDSRGDARGTARAGNDRRAQGSGSGSGRGRDGRSGDRDRAGGTARREPAPNQRGGRSSRTKDPLRVSKSTPIRDVVREGEEVVVQVSKEPIGTKGARVTSHISLPGRYVVYLPTVEHIGISKRIGSDKERARLREAIEAMKPPSGGLIVRTLAEGLTKKSLKADVGYLVRLWGEIAKKRETSGRAPENLYAELDLVLKTARDLFTDDIEKIVIDSRDEYLRLRRFVEMFMPDRVNAVELYEGEEPIFDAYGIEDEIGRALARRVPLSSGGYLIIDQAEALTAIDVNTGRFVGRGSKDLEDTILQTNLEAVEEIAYQLRFRNIGGLIILDLIDMERLSNREKVRRKLELLLANDKAKTTLNRISDLGLIEMTRKRTRESLGRIMNEPCFYCDGTGNLQSLQTVSYEILRQIKRERQSLRGYSVVINAHPAVIDFLKNKEYATVIEAERRYQRRIELVPRKEYHLEQFDLVGK